MENRMYISKDLYFRKKFYPPTEKKKEELEALLEGFIDDYDNGFKTVVDVYKEISEIYAESGIFDKLDYSDSECVYQLEIRRDSFYLINMSRPDLKQVFKITPEELEENFVSLRDFISKAQYVGKRGYITNPLFHDIYGIDEFNECLVLYSGIEGVLVVDNGLLIFLDSRYTEVNWLYEDEQEQENRKDVYAKFRLQFKGDWQDYSDYSDN